MLRGSRGTGESKDLILRVVSKARNKDAAERVQKYKRANSRIWAVSSLW